MRKDVQRDQEGRDGGEETRKSEKIVPIRLQEKSKIHFPSDDIRKELSCLEKHAQKEWNERFGHLAKENFQKIFSDKCKIFGVPEKLLEDKTSSKNVNNEKVITSKPSTSIPKTSSAMVGWRSSSSDCNLEILGKLYSSPRFTIDPPALPGEFKMTEQTLIFLG